MRSQSWVSRMTQTLARRTSVRRCPTWFRILPPLSGRLTSNARSGYAAARELERSSEPASTNLIYIKSPSGLARVERGASDKLQLSSLPPCRGDRPPPRGFLRARSTDRALLFCVTSAVLPRKVDPQADTMSAWRLYGLCIYSISLCAPASNASATASASPSISTPTPRICP